MDRPFDAFRPGDPMKDAPPREPIVTERLLLRDCTLDDAASLHDLDHRPEVVRAVGSPPACDVAWYLDRIGSVYVPYRSHHWQGIRVVDDRVSGRFLGWVFVRPATRSRDAPAFGWHDAGEQEIGYRYLPEAWGRGVATEAARALLAVALDDPTTGRIVAAARRDNRRSLRVLEKLGFVATAAVTLAGVDGAVVTLALPTTGAGPRS